MLNLITNNTIKGKVVHFQMLLLKMAPGRLDWPVILPDDKANSIMSLLNSSRQYDAHMRQWTRLSLFQIVAGHMFSAKPLSDPMLAYF